MTQFATPTNPNPHTLEVIVEVNVFDAISLDDARDTVEAALERIDGITLGDGRSITLEVPVIACHSADIAA